jgi:hypothetical protein
MTINIDDIHENAEGAVILDGLDDAIIGIVEEFGNGPRILYSKKKFLISLKKETECLLSMQLNFTNTTF